MINNQTTSRFVLLTPFQEPLTYHQRLYVNGEATDTYKDYYLPKSRSREIEKNDAAVDRLGLFAELLNTVNKAFEIWSPVMASVGMPNPKKDDYVTDACCNEWTIFHIESEFHSNVWMLYCVKRQ